MLDRDHTSTGEGASIPLSIDLIDDRCLMITFAQEIGVQRVHDEIIGSSRGGGERLSQHLTAENSLSADISAFSTEEIGVETFEGQESD